MKIEMLNDYGGLKKGRIYQIKESTGLWLIGAKKARIPGKFFVKGDETSKQEIKETVKRVKEPVKAKRTRRKK